MRTGDLGAERCPRCDRSMLPRADQAGWHCPDCEARSAPSAAAPPIRESGGPTLPPETSREGELDSARERSVSSPAPSTQTIVPPRSPQDQQGSASTAAGPGSSKSFAEADALPSRPASTEALPKGLPDIAPVASRLDPASLVGRVLGGRYRLESVLGSGAMGVVYRGVQVALNKPYAIKVLLPSLTHDPQFDARFRQEARIAAAIRHPGLVEVFDYGFEDGVAYYVMELLEGRTLSEHLRTCASLSPSDAARIVAAAAEAVSVAHGKGVVHRDLKPANIFLARDSGGRELVKVLDFGVSKTVMAQETLSPMMSASGLICGTPAYMSPEQVRCISIDGRSDVYSLGIVLYRLLAGQLPFEAPESVVLMCMHLDRAPPPLPARDADAAVPPALEKALFRAIAKRPEDRFASAGEFADALRAAMEEPRPTRTRLPALQADPPAPTQVLDLRDQAPAASFGPTTPGQRTPARRRSWLGALAALGGIGALAAVLIYVRGSQEPPDLPRTPPRESRNPEARDPPASAAPGATEQPTSTAPLPNAPLPNAPAPLARPGPPSSGSHGEPTREAREAQPPAAPGSSLPLALAPPGPPAPRLDAHPPRPPRPQASKSKLALTSKARGTVAVLAAGAKWDLRLNVPKLLDVPAGKLLVTFMPEGGKPCSVWIQVPAGGQGALVFGPAGDAVEALEASRRRRLACLQSP